MLVTARTESSAVTAPASGGVAAETAARVARVDEEAEVTISAIPSISVVVGGIGDTALMTAEISEVLSP